MPQLSPSTTQQIVKADGCFEISIYKENNPTAEVLAWSVKTLRACYPDTDAVVFDILLERFKANGWGNDKIKDAVNNLIEKHVYKTINPANILTFDRKKKLYSYNQMIELVNKYGATIWENYSKENINGKIWYFENE